MLQFDHLTDQFLLDQVRFGPGSTASDTAMALGIPLRDFPQPGWQNVEYADGAFTISLSFKDGLLHSGSIIADVEGAGWEDLQERRRAAHLALMQSLFGCDRYESGRLIVYPFRNPRDGIDQIMLEVR